MARILAIDFGSKRVGLAVTDPLQIIATALDTVHSKDVMQYLQNYLQNEEVESFVLGLPQNLSGEDTNATPLVESFAKQLQNKFPDKPIYRVDERFTSKIALDTMIAGGSKKKDRQNKGNLDKISAVLILQTYMEQKNTKI